MQSSQIQPNQQIIITNYARETLRTMNTNQRLLKQIYDSFEDIFEYNDYTWDEIEYRIAHRLQSNLISFTSDNDLYTCDKKLIENIQVYFSYYSINDTIRNILPILNGIIRFDYNKMKQDNEDFYNELNKHILKPERIQNMAAAHNIDFFEYLDTIM